VLEEFVVRTRVIFQSGSDKMDITRFILKRKMQMRFLSEWKKSSCMEKNWPKKISNVLSKMKLTAKNSWKSWIHKIDCVFTKSFNGDEEYAKKSAKSMDNS